MEKIKQIITDLENAKMSALLCKTNIYDSLDIIIRNLVNYEKETNKEQQ